MTFSDGLRFSFMINWERFCPVFFTKSYQFEFIGLKELSQASKQVKDNAPWWINLFLKLRGLAFQLNGSLSNIYIFLGHFKSRW